MVHPSAGYGSGGRLLGDVGPVVGGGANEAEGLLFWQEGLVLSYLSMEFRQFLNIS